ncbi:MULTISPECIES: hypothetical protein [unclassified Streptomyces]|uniref:hypothetical protein n=1 Tax=unclassified Streptomyces TaxID=2593676 RepID=UPI0033B4C64F
MLDTSRLVEVLVSNNDRDRYPARIDPADQRHGYVRPWFDLETAHRIAEQTQADAERFGHGSIDTVHVFPGGKLDGHEIGLVVVVTWMDIPTKGVQDAVEICERSVPDDEDEALLYSIGGHDWCWYALDDQMNPLIPFPADK